MASKYVGGGSRGRPCGIMLLLAMGAAVFAAMLLHKMRERRIFNIVITEKDHNLLTLQLLLQKERDSVKEMKRKIEELKSKAHSLRSQKKELSDKLMEMQSITSSLREEQRTLESALDEKQNEVRMLKEKEALNSIKEISQITTLTEMLKQKEAEIKEMKYQMERSITIWSDPSKPPANVTVTEVSSNSKTGTSRVDNANLDSSEGQPQLQENNQVGEGLGEKVEGDNKHAEDSKSQEEISGDIKMTRMEDSQDNRDTAAEITTSGDDGVVKDKDEGSTARENDFQNDEISDTRNLHSRRSVTKGRKQRIITGDWTRNSEEDGASEIMQVKVINEGKPEGKLWREIHRARKFEKNNSSQDQKNVKRMGKQEVDSWGSSHTEEVGKEGEIVVDVQLGSLQKQDEVRRASGNRRTSSENEDNANANRSEDMDFTYDGKDQRTDADEDESANTN